MNKVFIIAEAGVNHNGDIDLAYKLIDAAKDAGADAVKFQSFKAENLVSKYAEKADYQKKATKRDESQFEMIKKLELGFKKHILLMDYCKLNSIMFLSSPFDLESIDMLDEIGIEIFKIPSGEINNLPYLRKIGKLRKKVILSTGMANLEEIEIAIKILNAQGTKDITILHCNTEYPTPMEDVNLKAMISIKEEFDLPVGYSDHTLGIEVAIASVALGAKVIEKHFTIDKNMEGPDHKASLEPSELKIMVATIRNIEKALGDGIKKPSKSEIKNKDIARKSIVAKYPIIEGEIFSENNITIKRPGNGISPLKWDDVLGKKAKQKFNEDEMIVL